MRVVFREGADDGVSGQVDGVVLGASLKPDLLIAGSVTFDQVEPFLVVARIGPNLLGDASIPERGRSLDVAYFVVGEQIVEEGQVGGEIEDVATSVGSSRVVEFGTVVEGRPVVGDVDQRRADEDGRERGDGDGFLDAVRSHVAACADIARRAGPVAEPDGRVAGTAQASRLIAGAVRFAIACFFAVGTPVSSSAGLAVGICRETVRLANADASDVVAL